MPELIRVAEPLLQFRYGQAMEDPRDGLTLFGPLDDGKPYGIRAGVVGSKCGIELFRSWLKWVQTPIRTSTLSPARPPFPGIEAVFRTQWAREPYQTVCIDEDDLYARLFLDDRHQRVFETVDLYASAILRSLNDEEAKPDVWFVVIPDIVRKYCRPQSVIDPELRIQSRRYFDSARQAKALYREPSLFEADNIAAEPYFYKEHFRNQLKARLLKDRVPTQVVRESTLSNIGQRGESRREQTEQKLQSQIAWNISTTGFYKSGGRPWKVSGIRNGVCYIGLVFKKDDRSRDGASAACGAQMFLDSGDGVVFKGAVGKWYNATREEFHLSREAAFELVSLAVNEYKAKHGQSSPSELFIHGQTWFNRDEWEGFKEAAGLGTNVVGVRIRDDKNLKLFRKSDTPVLRGTAYIRDDCRAFLWTRGWVPRLATYPGMEVPNPLSIELCQGSADIRQVLADVLALTKLNYNTCRYGDGKPITLKFADAVGEVLTVGPSQSGMPLPFMYYI